MIAALLLLAGCAPDPRPREAARLLDQLDAERVALAQDPARAEEACGTAETVTTRLEGVPGLSELRPTYLALRSASDALAAACGQTRLLNLPADEGLWSVQQSRQRWHEGARRELTVVCQALRDAARSLGRPAPAC